MPDSCEILLAEARVALESALGWLVGAAAGLDWVIVAGWHGPFSSDLPPPTTFRR